MGSNESDRGKRGSGTEHKKKGGEVSTICTYPQARDASDVREKCKGHKGKDQKSGRSGSPKGRGEKPWAGSKRQVN